MPSLEVKTNVKLDDPKAFVAEFSQVRLQESKRGSAEAREEESLTGILVVRGGPAKEAEAVHRGRV